MPPPGGAIIRARYVSTSTTQTYALPNFWCETAKTGASVGRHLYDRTGDNNSKLFGLLLVSYEEKKVDTEGYDDIWCGGAKHARVAKHPVFPITPYYRYCTHKIVNIDG